MPTDSTHISFVFFGSSRLSMIVLDELLKLNYKPTLIVTTPDKPQGRKLEIKPNVVKEWALSHDIQVLSPVKLDAEFITSLSACLPSGTVGNWPLFVVASYGKIIPEAIINLPTYKTLNIHPSLLPRYRGASPLPTAILENTKNTGVTIMQLDVEMDHGPIVAQKSINLEDHFKDWPTYEVFEEMMAREGADLLARILPDWIAQKIRPVGQNHQLATYTKKINKEDGLIDLKESELVNIKNLSIKSAYDIFRKIQAFHEWPQVFFFVGHNGNQIRVKITDASFNFGRLIINKVIPEGKKEMTFDDFIRGYFKKDF